MGVYETILGRRTIRRFKNVEIPYEVLEKCVNAARLAPSARNLQPWEFIIVDREDLVPQVFSTLGWAGYIQPRGNPPPGEEPKAYIVILNNTNISSEGFDHDIGIVAGYMTLVALEHGIGTCILRSINRDKLRQILNIPDTHTITLMIALGYPNESPVVEEFTDTIKYWRDDQDILHVPKRKLANILHHNVYRQP